MKMKVLNVFKSTGIGKKTNAPFSISRATVLTEFEDVNTSGYQRNGAGLGTVEVAVSDDFYPILEKHVAERFKGEILELDVRTSVGRRGDVVITGLEGHAPGPAIPSVQGPRAA